MPDLLSYAQISQRFPLQCECSEQAWVRILAAYREQQRLVQYRDYKDGYVDGRICRVYLLRPVVRQLVKDARREPPRPIAVYLCTEYRDEFQVILDAPATFATDKQAPASPQV